jgi:hypothetical protein
MYPLPGEEGADHERPAERAPAEAVPIVGAPGAVFEIEAEIASAVRVTG